VSSNSEVQPEKLRFSVKGEALLSRRFAREHPAADEGPEAAWTLAEQTIDHGAFLLEEVNAVRPGRETRDLVLAALLRRALVTAEGIRRCLFHSLEEPAIALLRTLLEVELNLRIVVADETDRMAKRLGAYHYIKAKRHVTNLLKNREIQEGDEEFRDFMKGAGKRHKEYFASPVFDEVRCDLERSQHWHGHKSVQDAFEAVGGGTEYLQLYDSFSPFVHAANLDHDFVEVVDDQPHMRALIQRDPIPVQHYLKGAVLILIRIMDLYLEEKGAADYSQGVKVVFETGEELEISPLRAFQQHAVAVWGSGEGWMLLDNEESVGATDTSG
jgi:hypothetical protein